MGIIMVGVLVGALVFSIGIVRRKKWMIVTGSPAVALLVCWMVLANIPPNSRDEFVRRFGDEAWKKASGIQTTKPMFMDGYFVSFRIGAADFESSVRPQFSSYAFTNASFLRKERLPVGWPSQIASLTHCLYREADYDDVFVFYSYESETAYAVVWYGQW